MWEQLSGGTTSGEKSACRKNGWEKPQVHKELIYALTDELPRAVLHISRFEEA